MADTIVTLSGDDAQLYKAFQRILEQQAKAEGGYDRLKKKSKETGDAAAKAAKETAEAEAKAAKEAAETRKRAEREAADASRQADREFIASSRNVAAEQKAAAKEAEKTAKAQQKADAEATRAREKQVGHLKTLAVSYLGVSTAINVGVRASENMVTVQEKSAQLARDLATAQQEAAKNMAGTDAPQLDETLQKRVPEIAIKTSFPDLPEITKALGATQAIIGPELALKVVEENARINKFTPDQLSKSSTATADIMKASGMQNAQEVLALLSSAIANARPEQLTKLSTGAATVTGAAIVAAPAQDKVAATKEGIAIYSALSALDPQGESSAQATGDLIAQLKNLFTDPAKTRERTQKIADLRGNMPENELAVRRADFELMQAEKKAVSFGVKVNTLTGQVQTPKTLPPEGRDAVLDFEKRRNDVSEAQRKFRENQAELQRLQAVDTATKQDPGTTMGRLAAVRQNPALRLEMQENLTGEQKYKPLFMQLIEGGNEFSATLGKVAGNITTDVNKYNDLVGSMATTPEQRLVAKELEAKTAQNVGLLKDRPAQIIDAVSKMRAEALSNSSSGLGTALGTVFNNATDSVNRTIESPSQYIFQTQKLLNTRLRALGGMDPLDFSGSGPVEQPKIDALVGTIGAIQKLTFDPSTIEVLKQQNIDVAAFLQRQNELAESTNRLLEQIRQKQIDRQPTPAPAQRAQAALGGN